MNKIYSFFATASFTVLMLTSCSTEDLSMNMNTVTCEPSEIAIQLGAGSVAGETRAAVQSETTLPSTMGVWCLAKGKQNPDGVDDITWQGSAIGCVMDNVEATLKNGAVKWVEDVEYYYPMSQYYNYEFYANYPYTDMVQNTGNLVTANYKIDGCTDLIWGRATSDEDYAWSAKYFRKNGFVNLPTVEMQHLLTRLTFSVEPGETVEGSGDYTEAAKMKVLSIEVCDVPVNVTMNIANMGTGEVLALTDDVTETLTLCEADGAACPTLQVPATPADRAQMGESMMLYPAKDFKVRIKLQDSKGTNYTAESTIKLASGFEAGSSYAITVVVHGPQEIVLKANIKPWDEVVGPEIVL